MLDTARLAATDGPTGRDGPRRTLTMLVASAGRRVALIEAFRRGAAAAGVDLTVLACDREPELSAACHAADARFAIPSADDPGYADALLSICRLHDVSLVVPTIDPELAPLAQAAVDFAAIGCRVAVSEPETIAIARDKLATAEFLGQVGIVSPATTTLEAARSGDGRCVWPVIVKPRGGSASRGLTFANSADDLPADPPEPMIVQQLLRGEEWTVNLFFDRHGALQTVVPHRRLRVRAGEVEKGVVVRDPALTAMAEKLAAALPGPRGALCFQVIRDAEGGFAMFEINARFGGGYPLADRAGATFARWLIEEAAALPCTASDGWQEGITMLRYDAAVFVDACD